MKEWIRKRRVEKCRPYCESESYEFHEMKLKLKREREESLMQGGIELIRKSSNSISKIRSIYNSDAFENADKEKIVDNLEVMFEKLIEEMDLELIEPKVGDNFNEQIHKIVNKISTDKFEKDQIVNTLKEGYIFKGEVVLQAEVEVEE